MISRQTLEEANMKMVGNTARTILFTTVSLAPESPSLSKLLHYLHYRVETPATFAEKVRQELTVRSFEEFIDKFAPCYFYRLRPAHEPVEAEQFSDTDSMDAESFAEDLESFASDSAEAAVSATEDATPTLGALPYYEFSLEGGPENQGWRKVTITLDHPFLISLQRLVKERSLGQKASFQVSVDSALFGFKPRAQFLNARRKIQDLAAASERLTTEMRRNPNSPDTRRALDLYERKLFEMENALGDDLRQIPIITHGLGESLKAIGNYKPLEGEASSGDYILALGERGKVVAKARELPDAQQSLKALDAASQPSGGREIVKLTDALESRPLAKREIREIAKLPPQERYPALVGSFMSEMIRIGRVNPLVGNVLAVVLQDPRQLAEWSIDVKEVAVYHDTFLGIYSRAIEDFLRTVSPLFETIMGVYLFFNEFPIDIRDARPELIVANDELSDLWEIYHDAFVDFVRTFCLQENNHYRDAFGFAIVPSVQPLLTTEYNRQPTPQIRARVFEEDYAQGAPTPTVETDRIRLDEEIETLRRERMVERGGYGRATESGALLGLLELAYECGFVVFFSPEERLISGRIVPQMIDELIENYAPRSLTSRAIASAAVLCMPDFSVLPPDGVLITGKVSDGREVGVEVPEIVVRGCYVAAGRYAANDHPKILARSLLAAPRDLQKSLKVRTQLPGVSLDLDKYPYLGTTNIATDHFTENYLTRQLIGRDKPFLIFTQVSGQPPYIAQAHTLYLVARDQGQYCYVPIHHYRQYTYLKRLLKVAHAIGRGGAWPRHDEMQTLMDNLIQFFGWYDINKEGYVNSFPSLLEGDKIIVEPIGDGASQRGYHFKLPFPDYIIGEMEITF
jgi:hypothetical protein